MRIGWPDRKMGKGSKKAGRAMFSGTSAMDFDLLYQLSYMSVIASSGVPRKLIFERAAEVDCAAAESFRKVELACQTLKYDYAKACKVVAESTEEPSIKEILLRFSSSMISGEPEGDFLAREATAQANNYTNTYDRKLETLKMWTDGYVSLILSSVLVIIMGIVSTMIWTVNSLFLMGLVTVSVGTTALGVWLLYLVVPREIMIPRQADSREQKLTRKMFRFSMLPTLVLCAALLLTQSNLGWVLLAIAAMAFPTGYMSSIGDRKVIKRDGEAGPFIASLGGVCTAIGSTVKEGLGRIDLDSLNMLRPEIRRLSVRLRTGIGTRLCWKKFTEETGSELIRRSIGMFCDAVEIGGVPEEAGHHASLFTTRIALLRSRRRNVSTPFSWLCWTMHTAVIALLVFVTEVIGTFGEMLGQAQGSMPDISGASTMNMFTTFSFSGLELMKSLLLPLIVVFTVSNALAPAIAEGGDRYRILQSLTMTTVVSGICLICLPPVAAGLFQSIQR
ncbi:MAG TPA: hypothetical protein G4O07_00155 [Dehalococcoidia bacterium]|nr:hypothetical protein [Dehalococcoidia bacterium]